MKGLSLIDKIKVQYDFLRLVGNPNDTRRIVSMGQYLTEKSEPELIEKIVGHAFANPKFAKMWSEKYFPQVPSLDKLALYPKKSLGHEYYLHMVKFNLDPNLFPKADFSSREMYMITRLYQVHDLWHVLTGFDTSVEQELGLQAFGVAQYRAPMSALIIAGGILHLIRNDPLKAASAIDQVGKGYQLGLRSSFLLAEPILEELDQPLENLQHKYNLQLQAV